MFKSGVAMWLAAASSSLWIGPVTAETPGEPLQGVVVESVGGWTLEKAGLQPGDVLLTWKRLATPPANPEPAEGVIASYFDWEELVVEQAPRGTVLLGGRRGEETREFVVEPGLWEVGVRPVLLPELEVNYDLGKKQLAAGDPSGAVAVWRQLAEALPAADHRDPRAWMLLSMGRVWGEIAEYSKATDAAQEALRTSQGAAARAAAWVFLAKNYTRSGDYAAAEAAYGAAAPGRLGLQHQSLREVARLNDLGEVVGDRGDIIGALGLFRNALVISESNAPKSLVLARTLNNLGVVAHLQGDLLLAQELFIRVVQIQSELCPGSLVVAQTLSNLGVAARSRSDFDGALDHFHKAIKIRESIDPGSLSMATLLNNLGELMWSRGSLESGAEYYERALEIRERLAPNSLTLSTSLNNMGQVMQARGRMEEARKLYYRALRIQRKLAPVSLNTAGTLENLGLWFSEIGKPRQAESFIRRALDLESRIAPGGLVVAATLNNLAFVVRRRGRLDEAEDLYRRSVSVKEQLDPGSANLAISIANLSNVAVERGEFVAARTGYSLAVAALERQLSRLGGSYNVQAGFRTQHRGYYLELIDLLLAQNSHREAFQTLERYRAQTFLSMLAERDIAFSADISEELDRQRRRVGVLYDRTLKKLASFNPRDHAKEIEEVRTELSRLEDEAGDIEASIRKASPRLAALRYPEPLSAERAAEALDPGTLLLAYSVSKDSTALFALSRGQELEVRTIPLGQGALRSQVERLLALIPEAKDSSTVTAERRVRFEALSRQLFQDLLGPFAARIAASDRLLILPDGPLHSLPFGLLRRDGAELGSIHLAAWKPLHVALSATVYAELRQRRRRSGEEEGVAPLHLAAFGDPTYPQSLALAAREPQPELPPEVPVDAVARGVTERGLFDWEPLPHTRHEVEGIARLFPPGSVRTFLGSEALEERVKSLDRGTRILHLAAHGKSDEHLPSGSFVALTVPEEALSQDDSGRDNGLLQTWEILERVRIDADLVVLSACETGRGKELGGEGLIGLTRAFQYAGARTVLASLWNVNDQATAELMIRFYRHLRTGLPKDRALQAAQQELIAGPIEVVNAAGEREWRDFSTPYYWAGFQLYGDWQ